MNLYLIRNVHTFILFLNKIDYMNLFRIMNIQGINMQARENKFPYFVLIVQLIWPPYAVLVCDWLFFSFFKKKIFSNTSWPN